MKAALIFTGSGPILVLTTFGSLQSHDFLQRLAARGITKFITHEVAPELVQKRYGARFSAVMGDLSQKDDLRVMDIDGHHVLNSFAFEEIDLHRVEICIVPRNANSRRIMEVLAIREEGLAERFLQINGVWEDHLRYAITTEEWCDRRDDLATTWLSV